jgi:hypothetical protein
LLIKVNFDEQIIKKIEKFINQGAYSDIQQFVNVAVSNQLQEEISAVVNSNTSDNLSSELTLVPASYQNVAIDRTMQYLVDWRQFLRQYEPENSQIEPQSSDLIWYFYNRFFPVKVVIHELAKIMAARQRGWIELVDLQVQAFEFAQETATKLKNIEIRAKMARNKKLSTGLPASSMELISLRGTARKKKDDKLLRGRTRFMDQIVGKYVPKDNTFSGACFELGLIGIKQDNEISYVSLTELGKQFALLENPILDKDSFESAFSDKEVQFILENIYKRFKLENKIVMKIIECLKKESLTSRQIDQFFIEENRKSFTLERISTMGRLSELQIVNWEIDSEGKSQYTLNFEKVNLLN